ncbi:MAG TPA: AMP-binding protein [Armatimonadota bacterium]|nr:AMP-binding protein [Armatimonadota bacterium]
MPERHPNVAALLSGIALAYPDRLALVQYRRDRRERVTFAQLAERVECAVSLYRAKGLRPGDRVLVLVPMSIDLYVTLIACFHAGLSALFVDAWADRRRLADAIRAARPRAFVGSRKAQLLRLICGELRRIPVQITADEIAVRTCGPAPGPEEVDPEDPALITLTTGSTGTPKAAARSHRFLWAQHQALARYLCLRVGDVDLTTLPIVVLNNLTLGITTVLPDFDPRHPTDIDPATLYRQIEAEDVTTSSGSPAFYERLALWCVRSGRRLPFRAVFTGGAPVLPSLGRLLSETVEGEAHAIYGSTEAEPIAGIEIREMLRLIEDEGLDGLPAGHPVPGIALRLARPHEGSIELDGRGWAEWEVGRGETGEVIVAGEHVLGRYLENPEADHAGKIRDGNRIWHRTGDAARLDTSGRLWLMGRLSARVRQANGTWWPLPGELRARQTAPVTHAAYFGAPENTAVQRAVLCVETAGGRLDATSRDRVLQELSPYPADEFHVLPRIPRDPRHASKTDLTALREMLAGRTARQRGPHHSS